jgi:hypothetical protein
MEKVITIPKNRIWKDDLVIIEKTKFRKLSEENEELRSALQAILAGELALRKGKTRTFRQFLKSKFPAYAKNL